MIRSEKVTFFKEISVVEVTAPHSVHILWIFPPGFILDIGIILFSVPGLEFAYSQAPACMKSVIMAGWLLTTAVGNLIIVIIQAIDLFEKSVSKTINFVYNPYMFYIAVLQFFTLLGIDAGRCFNFCDNGCQIQIRGFRRNNINHLH